MPSSVYTIDKALVGASVDAIVGTIIKGIPISFATTLAVSIVLPPPIPIKTLGLIPKAIFLTLSISFIVHSPLNLSVIIEDNVGSYIDFSFMSKVGYKELSIKANMFAHKY